MKNLLREVRKNKRIIPHDLALFLDYDGTLTPIVANAEEAHLKESVRLSLQALSEQFPLLAIISGRALKNVRAKVGVSNLVYAGNHGLEIEGKGLKKRVLVPGFLAVRRKIKAGVPPLLERYPGAWLEDKGLSLSLHYRQVEPKFQKILLREVNDFLERFHSVIITRRGKKVLELRQRVRWGKGEAVAWILKKMGRGLTPLYIGDDHTDEDVFSRLKRSGITCVVEKKVRTDAKYYLASPREVASFLSFLLRQRVSR